MFHVGIFSAGVGRTGTFVCIDYVLEQVKKENMVDIAGAINKMRHQRMLMVQTSVSIGIHLYRPLKKVLFASGITLCPKMISLLKISSTNASHL